MTLIRHTKLKDDPTVRWREELVSDIILRQVRPGITVSMGSWVRIVSDLLLPPGGFSLY